MEASKIIDYGYVPFKGFRIFIFTIIILTVIFPKNINDFLDKILKINQKKDKKNNINNLNNLKKYIKYILFLIPILSILYFDINYSSFSMKNLGINKYISNKKLNYLLRLIGSYGIIQVLAQDIGVKTGLKQRNIVQTKLFQFILYFCTAYTISNNRSEALVGSLLYFILKYGISNNELSNICFEDV